MMTMFRLDLACLCGSWKSLVPVTLFVAVMITVSTGVAGGVAAVAVMLPMMIMNSLFAIDVDGGWQELRLTMPLTRGHVVAGRYATAFLAVGVGALVGLAVGAAAYLLRDVLAPYVNSDLGVNAWVLAGALYAGACFALLMQAFTIPFVMCIGFTKAVRFVPLLFMAFMFVLVGLGRLAVDAFGVGTFAWITSLSAGGVTDGVFGVGSYDLSLALIALVAAAVTLACLAASYAVSRRLYAKREF